MGDVVDTTVQTIPGQTSASPPDTGQGAASPPAAGAEGDGTPTVEAVPFDKNPKWIAAREAEKQRDELLSTHGYENLEDLVSDLQAGKNVMAAIGDRDLNTIIANSETLDKYNAHWADQATATEAEGQTADDKVSALEKRLNDLITSGEREKLAATEKEQNIMALDTFKSEVNSFMAKDDTIPEEYRPFIAEFSGVDNRFNDIENISDKTQVRAMLSDHVKKVQDFAQVVIKLYRDGKISIPPISEITPVDTSPKAPQIKNIKEAGKSLLTELVAKRRAEEAQP